MFSNNATQTPRNVGLIAEPVCDELADVNQPSPALWLEQCPGKSYRPMFYLGLDEQSSRREFEDRHFKVTIHSGPGDFLTSPTALSAHPKVQVTDARRHAVHRQQALLGKKLGEAGASSRRRRQKALYLRH